MNTFTINFLSLQQIRQIRCSQNIWSICNGKFKKSDVVVKDFLVECKTAMAEKSQFTIKKDWLEKLKLEALANHKSMYALAFNFGGEEKHNYFVINEQQFKLLKDLYSEKFSN